MNFGDDDYIMGHLLNAARATGNNVLEVDLLSGHASPPQLLVEPVARSVRRYCDNFPDLVSRSGSDPSLVKTARLRVAFDTSIVRPVHRHSPFTESPYVCTSTLQDDRGKTYETTLRGYWYPEKLPTKTSVRDRLRRWFT
jgi:hypothetical protein